MRDSFIFYRSFYEAIKDLPRDIQGEIYTAIMEYSLYGKETDNLKPVARSIFTLIKPQIDVNNKRFDNGCKGGRPLKKETKEEPSNNQKETKEETKEEPNKNDNVNDNNININKETSPNGEEKKGELSFHSSSGNIDYNGLMNWYNELFKDKLPAIKSMTETRKKAVKARIAQYSKESVRTVFNLVLQSSFLLGGNDRNWKCDFDWIFKQTNYTKILEGNYNGTRLSKNQQDSEQRKRDSVFAVATTIREVAAKKRKELEAEGIIE